MRKEAAGKTDVEALCHPGECAAPDPATIDVVSRMQRVLRTLSPAERRGRRHRLRRFRGRDPHDHRRPCQSCRGEPARRSRASAARVGCASFSEFKISLATTLTVAAAYLKSDRVFDDDIGHLAQSIMMRAAGAVRECLDQLDTAARGTGHRVHGDKPAHRSLRAGRRLRRA